MTLTRGIPQHFLYSGPCEVQLPKGGHTTAETRFCKSPFLNGLPQKRSDSQEKGAHLIHKFCLCLV